MLKRTLQNKILRLLTGSIFVFASFFFVAVHSTQAATLSSCGELSVPDSYFLDTNIDTGDPASPCIVISTNGVSINKDIYSFRGNITLQDNGGGSPYWVDYFLNDLGDHTWTFKDASQNNGTVYGDTTFNNSSFNGGDVYGNATFNDTSHNGHTIDGNATFNDTSRNDGTVYGDTTFNDTSYNYGDVYGNATFNDTSINDNYGVVYGNATFNGTAYSESPQRGTVNGSVIFPNAVTFTINSSGWEYDTSGWDFQSGAEWVFNNSNFSSYGTTITGTTTFNGASAYGDGIIIGDVTFNNNSYCGVGNDAFIIGDVTFNGDSYAYDSGCYMTRDATFNDTSYNSNSVDGNATFNDTSINNGNVYGDTTFNDTSINNSYNVYANVDFYDSSEHGSGNIVGIATFHDSSYIYSQATGNLSNIVFASSTSVDYVYNNDLNCDNLLGCTSFGSIKFNQDVTFNVNSERWVWDTSGWDFNGNTPYWNFSDDTYLLDIGILNGDVTFNGNSYNDGIVYGDTTFNDTSINNTNGGAFGNTTFNDTSYNDGFVYGDTTFNGTAYSENPQRGTVDGTVIFPNAVIFELNSYTWDEDITNWIFSIGATFNFNSGQNDASFTTPASTTINFINDGTSNHGNITITSGNTANFYDESYNYGTLTGNASGTVNIRTNGANDFLQVGTVEGIVDVYYPTLRPLDVTYNTGGGTVNATVIYHDYPEYHFYDGGTPANGNQALYVGEYDYLGNWYLTSDYINATTTATSFPGTEDDVYIHSSLLVNYGVTASVRTATFYDTAENQIEITVSDGAFFKEYSQNLGTINGDATFEEDESELDSGATVSGSITRLFTETVTTIRNFTTNGGRNDWNIVARGIDVVVNIVGATYDVANNSFQALLGAVFDWGNNAGGQPVPVITINSPYDDSDQDTIKWAPDIDWDTSTVCEYRMGGSGDYTTIDCSENGADIPRPAAGSNSLYVKGTDTNGNITEKYVSFDYNNTVAVWTACGIDDPLDEATRPYYYLENGSTTNDCYVYVNTELRGNIGSGTGTLTGNIIASATTTIAGKNITLRNITVTGNVTSNGGTTGKNGGNISTYSSTISGTITSNGGTHASGNGGNGGTITIATSTTDDITGNGASGTGDGGDGSIINITNSIWLNASSTTITANGGNSNSCGNGGDSGEVTLTDSAYGTLLEGTIVLNPGLANEETCSGSNKQNGSVIQVDRTGQYTAPSSGGAGAGAGAGASPSSNGTSNLFRNLNLQNPLDFTPIPFFTPFGADFVPSNIGGTSIPDPFANFVAPGSVYLTPIPKILGLNISAFIFAPIPSVITDALKDTPKLANLISSLGISNEQQLASLATNPKELILEEGEEVPPGLFIIKSGETTLKTYLTYVPGVGLAQLVKVSPNQLLQLSLIPQSTGQVTATYLDKVLVFTDSIPAQTTLNTPASPGQYILETVSAPIPLLIEVIPPPTQEESKPWGIFNFAWEWFH